LRTNSSARAVEIGRESGGASPSTPRPVVVGHGPSWIVASAAPRCQHVRVTSALDLVARLASATRSAHTEATLGAELARAMDEALPLVSLSLTRDGQTRVWTGAVRAPAKHTQIVPLGGLGELTLALGAPLDADLARAIGAVIEAGLAHVDTLSRVASLSRRAHERLSGELADARLPEGVVARSPETRRLFHETLPLVAREDVTVLLRGETGTGKEVVARRIHALSRRARRPMIVVNCAALPETLAESALFGHERGAFTGALARHVGLFERADGGTLLLDEVGELTAPMQARLLRVLERGDIERVGGSAPIRVDVRVIAATHRDLEARVVSGHFRQDLLYRLAVVPLVIAPLRQRPEDLDELVQAITVSLAARMGRAVPSIAAIDRARLARWPWPGNVRELRNVLERALVLTRGDVLTLPEGWDAARAETESFDDGQRRILREALAASGGRVYGKGGAAERLGLAPTTLRSKLEKLGLR
jgi:transcriptional regulator with GAF, ATPase, and Fis domain